MGTQTIGLFEAKTHLSELVARAEQGDEVIITRHNRPVARIVPFVADNRGADARQASVRALLKSASQRQLQMDWKRARDEGRR